VTLTAARVPDSLTRSVLREQLRERILQRILDGDYAPGERIVESETHRGVRVRTITEKEMGEMYPVRAALEEVAGRAAAPQITDAVLDAPEAEIDAMRAASERSDLHAQLVHDGRRPGRPPVRAAPGHRRRQRRVRRPVGRAARRPARGRR
jgi:DNA-binding GntR family transcriptional regulator